MNIIKRIAILLCITAFFISCSSTAGLITRDAVQAKTDEFENSVTFLGITKTEMDSQGLFAEKHHYFLRSFLDKETNDISHQLYVNLGFYDDWRFYNRASFVGGDNPEFIKISSDVNCSSSVCYYEEDVAVTIPHSFMKENDDGFKVKLSSQSGYEDIIEVTSQQITKQIQSIELSEYYQAN